MKKLNVFTLLLALLCIFGLGNTLWAYEGATKLIVTMTQTNPQERTSGPIFLVPSSELHPGKLAAAFFQRVPAPTLSSGSIREERLRSSLGTKRVVLFRES